MRRPQRLHTTGDHCATGRYDGGPKLTCGFCEICDTAIVCNVAPSSGCCPLDMDSLWRAAERLRRAGGLHNDFCVFDESAGAPMLALGADVSTAPICGVQPCWKFKPQGCHYHDKLGTAGGLTDIALKATFKGTTIKLKGKGAGLMTLALPLAKDPQLTVQLPNGRGVCWTAHYHVADKNLTAKFQARSD